MKKPYEESGIFTINPVVNAKNIFRENNIKVLNTSGILESELFENLQLKITASYNNRMGKNSQFNNSKTLRGTPLRRNNTDGVNGEISHTEVADWTNENTLTWHKYLNGGHYLQAMGGFSVSGRKYSTYGFKATNLPNEELGINGLSEGKLRTSIASSSSSTLASYMARVNYRFKSTYYATLTMRADGSSKFPTENKWGYFPSAAVSWKFGNEKFMKNMDFISNGRLRASYGMTGNNRVSDFAYRSSLSFDDLSAYSFNNEPHLGLDLALGNNKLKWETVKQLDLGLDVDFFNNRVSFVADVYRKLTDDMLLRTSIPGSSGYSSVYTNIGSIENKGLELTLNTVNLKTTNFGWTTSFNISFNKNNIRSLANGEMSRFSYISSFSTRMAEEPMYIAQVGVRQLCFMD